MVGIAWEVPALQASCWAVAVRGGGLSLALQEEGCTQGHPLLWATHGFVAQGWKILVCVCS